ncbi:hypothetical protein MIND_00956500 [Mycena indigotica]|uniref:Uncharacterized protein n=1 Tax=Mycena indigotica TaxID=2126181 RepID=A0A8H6W2R8_9AGAR|nr:uncharacterized protein MIND_00956500 [Mycena indigotica]KAF7297234.1 hypothetical protein MIND_00956500 [Mycena indigotica]
MFASPTKARRRAKAPVGTLGARLRQQRAPSRKLNENVFPSSLPPSSPIPTSSRHPSSEGEAEQQLVYSDFGSLVEEEPEVEEERKKEEEDDPFGFFAVERKLKTLRALRPLPEPEPEPAEEEDIPVQHNAMPSTPHKPRPGTRPFSPVTSSPSPIKPTTSLTQNPPADEPSSETEVEEPVPQPRRSARKRTRVDEKTESVKRRKPVSRVKKVDELELDASDPPKAPTKKNTRVLASNSKSKPASKTKPKSTTKPKSAKSETKSKSKGKEREKDDNSEDEAEQLVVDRLARIAYFKKLDDYSFEKENVYVV